MNYKLYLGRISGIKLFVHWTFLLLIGWVVYSDIRSGLDTESILWSVGFVFTIFGCVTLHELGHSLMAQRYHIRTRDITLLPIGGVASLESIPEKPKEELAVALAGPAVNVIIALILLPIIYLGHSPATFEGLGNISHSNFLTSLLSVNISLVVFNMIPAFPMDGGRVLRALLGFKLNHTKATTIAARIGQVIAVIFVVVGFYGNSFLIFIGIFIFMGAQTELKYAQGTAVLNETSIGEIMTSTFPRIASTSTIREAAQRLLQEKTNSFLVIQNDLPLGSLSREEVLKALGDGGENTLVEQAMDKRLLYLNAKLSIHQALKEMNTQQRSLAMVTDQDHVVGVIDPHLIASFLMLQKKSKS